MNPLSTFLLYFSQFHLLPSRVCLRLPHSLFHSDSPTETLYFSSLQCMPHVSPIWFYITRFNNIGQVVQNMKPVIDNTLTDRIAECRFLPSYLKLLPTENFVWRRMDNRHDHCEGWGQCERSYRGMLSLCPSSALKKTPICLSRIYGGYYN
jgi:hypothetical protein